MQPFVRHDVQAAALPVIASIPHSGVFVPPEIASRFTARHRAWLPDTDWFLPELYAFLPALGITTVEATYSRYVADLNRDPSRRLLGPFFEAVVAAHTADGAPIYAVAPDPEDLATRVERFHQPYHRELQRLLSERVASFASALLLDLHSYMVPIAHEVCLGDGNGTTCPAAITGIFERAFREQGFDVVVNTPYTGGYVVRSHARLPGVSALQIEVRYPLYMDCALIDQPVRPIADAQRIAAAQLRLRSAIARGVTEVLQM